MPTLIMTRGPLEEFLSVDFPPHPGRLRLLVGEKSMVQHLVLNLYLYRLPSVSSFSSCGIISVFYFPSCLLYSEMCCGKNSTSSGSSSPSATILRHQNNGAPHSPKYV